MLEGVALGGTCGTEGAGLELLLLLPPSPLKALILKIDEGVKRSWQQKTFHKLGKTNLSAMDREPAWDRRDILNLK